MSLIKQLWIATIALVILLFGASLAAMVSTSRDYTVEQINEKNMDNATSLALTISQMEKDPVNLELLIAAQFDTGHYQLIRLSDPNGNVLIERKKENTRSSAPSWFVQLLKFEIPPAYAPIQDGWTQYGRIKVESDTSIAYAGLWETSQRMFAISVLIGLVGALIGSLFLKRLLRPLHDVVQQAEAIGEKRFISINTPRTQEFKLLVQTMNQLTERVRNMLATESNRLEKLRREANHDSISGLMNRTYFFSRVNTMTEEEEDFEQGALIVVHLEGLSEVDKSLGHEQTNALLHSMGQALQEFTAQEADTFAARTSGTDFAVFCRCNTDIYTLASTIKGILTRTKGNDPSLDCLQFPTVGATFRRPNKISELYAIIQSVISELCVENRDVLHIMDAETINQHKNRDETEWRRQLTQALHNRRLKLVHFPVRSGSGKIIHLESPARIQLSNEEGWLPAGEFIPWASKLGLVSLIDVLVVEKALEALKTGADDIALNISTRAICDEKFRNQIIALLTENQTYANKLWLEVPERGVFNYLNEFREFCRATKPFGCKIGIEHVGANVSRLGELHDVGLDYIKIDVSVISEIDKNPGNQAFFQGLCLIARSIGLMTIAEGVRTSAEINKLRELGVDGMTGPVIK